jgi:hypothetical protein
VSWLTSARPSPAIVVAVVALVAAVAGTAIAGTGPFKVTSSKVKRIAKKEAKKVAPRSAQAFSNAGALIGPASNATILQTSIRAPKRGFLLIRAGSDVFGSVADTDQCAIVVDGGLVTSSVRVFELSGTTNSEEDCTTETTVRVGKGNHTVAFRSVGSGILAGNRYDEASLQVEWVKFGNGGASIAKTAKASGGSGGDN